MVTARRISRVSSSLQTTGRPGTSLLRAISHQQKMISGSFASTTKITSHASFSPELLANNAMNTMNPVPNMAKKISVDTVMTMRRRRTRPLGLK